MAISSASREKLSWLFLESILIVISILLAFWIDAWSSDQQERKNESLLLTSILSELQGWQENAVERGAFLAAVLKSSEKLLQSTIKNDSGLTGETVDELLGDIMWSTDPALYSAPVLNSVTSSGGITIVSNPELRRDLILWSIRLDRIRERAKRNFDFGENRLMPFMESNMSMLQVRNTMRHVPGFPTSTAYFGQVNQYQLETTTDHTKLLADEEFQALLIRKKGFFNDLIYLMRESFRADLDALVARLEIELSELDEK